MINNSLRGLVETARDVPEIGTICVGWDEGVLTEELLDLTVQDPQQIPLVWTTRTAGSIRTCRYKLREQQTEAIDRILDAFQAQDVGYFC